MNQGIEILKNTPFRIMRVTIAFFFLLLTYSQTALAVTKLNTQHESTNTSRISVELRTLTLVAGTGTPGVINIANNSVLVTARNIQAILPSDWTDVVQDASTCAVLPPKSNCSIQLIPGNTPHTLELISVQGINTTKALINIAVVNPASISLTSSSLVLNPGGAPATMIITNSINSAVTATNVTADFTGTNLFGNVTVNTCATIPPGSSCVLTFTPGLNVVPPTTFTIKGSNTTAISASIAILNALTTTAPANQTVDIGQTAVFSTSTSGGLSPYTYQWQISTDSGTTFNNIIGANNSSYTTPALNPVDSGNLYRVIVTDAVPQSVTSSAAIVSVNAALVTSSPTSITSNPVGQNATFTTTTTGGQTPYFYQWQVSTDSGVTFNNVSTGTGGTTQTYTTAGLTLVDSGNQYRVIVTDTFSEQVTSNAATVTVLEYAYVVDGISDTIYYCPINSNGTSFGTCNATGSFAFDIDYIAINPANTVAYVLSSTNQTVSACPIQTNGSLGTCTFTGSGFVSPRNIAIHPDGQFAYITNQNSISKCDIDSSNNLINCTTTPYASSAPLGIAIYSSGGNNYAYVGNADFTTSSVAYCALSSGNIGACTQTNQALNSMEVVSINPVYPFVYMAGESASSPSTNYYFYCAINSNGTIGACNSTSGSGSPPGVAPTGLAINSPINPANSLAYITNNQSTLTWCRLNNTGPFGTCGVVGGISFNPFSIAVT